MIILQKTAIHNIICYIITGEVLLPHCLVRQVPRGAMVKRKDGCWLMPATVSLLSKADSNHHKQNQNLLCYHYTIGQSRVQR